MNWTRLTLLLAVIAAGAIPSIASAQHHRHGYGRAGVGIYFGAPWPRYYYPPVGYPYAYPYAYAPVVVAPAQPQVYIEQTPAPAQAQPAPPPENYWYYCNNPQGYYPYVRDCAAGWQRVAPQPPGQR